MKYRELSYTINKFGIAYDEFVDAIKKIDIIKVNPPNFDINIYDYINIFPGGIIFYILLFTRYKYIFFIISK